MIKQLAWNVFKNTGDINSYLELVQVENLEKNKKIEDKNIENNLGENIGIDTKKRMGLKEVLHKGRNKSKNGNHKSKRSCYCRK